MYVQLKYVHAFLYLYTVTTPLISMNNQLVQTKRHSRGQPHPYFVQAIKDGNVRYLKPDRLTLITDQTTLTPYWKKAEKKRFKEKLNFLSSYLLLYKKAPHNPTIYNYLRLDIAAAIVIGISPNHFTSVDTNPLVIACQHDDAELIKFLCTHNADPDIAISDGPPVLFFAHTLPILKILSSYHITLDKAYKGNNILHHMIDKSNFDNNKNELTKFYSNKLKINARNNDNKTAVDILIETLTNKYEKKECEEKVFNRIVILVKAGANTENALLVINKKQKASSKTAAYCTKIRKMLFS